jgi:hypothetical protein
MNLEQSDPHIFEPENVSDVDIDGNEFIRMMLFRIQIQMMSSLNQMDRNYGIEDILLPKGWKFRLNQFSKFQFLNEEAKLIKNLKYAIYSVNRNYGIEDVDRFKMFMEITSIERRMENYSWEGSCTVPAGWKVRTAEGRTGKTFYLSPDGLQFLSRSLGLQHG